MYSSLSDSDAAIERAQRSLDTIEARTAALDAHLRNHADDTARAMFLLENLADTALTECRAARQNLQDAVEAHHKLEAVLEFVEDCHSERIDDVNAVMDIRNDCNHFIDIATTHTRYYFQENQVTFKHAADRAANVIQRAYRVHRACQDFNQRRIDVLAALFRRRREAATVIQIAWHNYMDRKAQADFERSHISWTRPDGNKVYNCICTLPKLVLIQACIRRWLVNRKRDDDDKTVCYSPKAPDSPTFDMYPPAPDSPPAKAVMAVYQPQRYLAPAPAPPAPPALLLDSTPETERAASAIQHAWRCRVFHIDENGEATPLGLWRRQQPKFKQMRPPPIVTARRPLQRTRLLANGGRGPEVTVTGAPPPIAFALARVVLQCVVEDGVQRSAAKAAKDAAAAAHLAASKASAMVTAVSASQAAQLAASKASAIATAATASQAAQAAVQNAQTSIASVKRERAIWREATGPAMNTRAKRAKLAREWHE